ncbi:hypothetical protein TNCV_4223351 [Trichonephila clavipes]|nr:hypothetical protein TNCV_4223351 [Trichonephila clavipes]
MIDDLIIDDYLDSIISDRKSKEEQARVTAESRLEFEKINLEDAVELIHSIGKAQIKYLGHIIGSGKHEPDPEKTAVINNLPVPKKRRKSFVVYLDCVITIPLDKLAIIADKVSEVVGSSSTICAATTVPPPSQSSSCSAQPTMDSLARQIQELSLQVAELTRERNSSRHQRYSSDRRRSHSRSRSVNRGSGIWYYHRRYKEQARKCVSPCAFVQINE